MSQGQPVGGEDRQETCRKLIIRLALGDEGALAELYDLTCSLVFGLAMRVLGNPEDAEETTLEVYLQVWRSAKSYEPKRGDPLTWLVTITRSRAIDRLRSSRRRADGVTAFEDDLSKSPDDPVHNLYMAERRERIQAAMEALKPEQRQVLEIAYFRGLTHREIAAQLRLPLGTVKTRIRMGLLKLRENLSSLEEEL